MSAQQSTTRKGFSDLPAELRNRIYESMRIPARTTPISFPSKKVTPFSVGSWYPKTIIHLNKQIRSEAASVIFQDVSLKYTPRAGFFTPFFPRALTRELPCWAKFAARVEVSLVCPLVDGTKFLLKFEVGKDTPYKITGQVTIPNTEAEQKACLVLMRKRSEELKAAMVEKLDGRTIPMVEDPTSPVLILHKWHFSSTI